MARVAASLPGYTTVARASEALHLAPRSVRDLIYAGRLPSLRIGRLHYLRATDLDLERRRRLGLRLPRLAVRKLTPPREQTSSRPVVERTRVDPELRRGRAAERAADVSRWAQRHEAAAPRVPFAAALAFEDTACAICHRRLRAGGRLVESAGDRAQLCLTCGRRALLDWADRRRLEAAAARHMAHALTPPGRPHLDPATRVA